MGAVIYADEEAYEERLQRLLDKLVRMTEERQQILSNADANNLYEYNERNPEQKLPAVLVIIDNFAELQENYELLVETTILPLIRRSLSMGITFVVAGNVPNNMPSKLYNLFGERVTFKQSNADRYLDIVGRGAIEIDDIPGQGIGWASRRCCSAASRYGPRRTAGPAGRPKAACWPVDTETWPQGKT
jgi:S-DNA-T family DNA segregation ATPase FtsK/SpoIIIE